MPPRIVLVAPPALEPVTLAEAKLFARVEHSADDALLTDLIAAARKRCEPRQGRAYLTQTWDLFLDCFPLHESNEDLPIELPRPPLQSVSSITYIKSDGTPVVITPTDYYVDSARAPGRVLPAVGRVWPRTTLQAANGVVVRFVAGYGAAASTVPEQTRLALKQLVAFWYVNRDATPDIPPEIDALLSEATGGFVYA